MTRLTFIIFVLVFVCLGYVVYLGKINDAQNRRQEATLRMLALKTAELEDKLEKLEQQLQEPPVEVSTAPLRRDEENRSEEEKPEEAVEEIEHLPGVPPKPKKQSKEKTQKKQKTEAESLEPSPKIYLVQRGDNLWQISRRLYHTPWRWYAIWQENQDRLPNYRRMRTGFKLKLPS